MNLTASLLLADFEVSARFKREIVNEYLTKSFWTNASLIFTVSAHSCCFADLTPATWQVTARQMYLTMITFPVFLSFLFFCIIKQSHLVIQETAQTLPAVWSLFDTSLTSQSQFLPPQNSCNNLFILLFFLPDTFMPPTAGRQRCSLILLFYPKEPRRGRERLKKRLREKRPKKHYLVIAQRYWVPIHAKILH